MTRTTRTWLGLRMAIWVWAATVGAAFAFAPLLTSQYYLVPGALVVATLVVCGALLRAVGISRPVVAGAQLVVLVEIVTILYARNGSVLGLLPSADTVRSVGLTIQATLNHAREYPPPVPDLGALDATLAVGMGLLAVVVDLLATSRRTVPLVGLVFLTVYMTPVSLLNGEVTMWAFVPGALGYVFLLAAAERRHAVGWGHHLADLGREATGLEATTRGKGLVVTGRRAGVAAVACAVVVPVFVPTLSPQLFGQGGGGASGAGNGDVTVNNPMLDLRRNLSGQSNSELVRVTEATEPPTYMRLTALNRLTDRGWTPGDRSRDTISVDDAVPDAPGVETSVIRRTVSAEVEISESFRTRWLPVVYAPRSVSVEGDWRVDENNLDVMAGGDDVRGAGVTYTFSSGVAEPTPAQLREAEPADDDTLRRLRALPPETPEVISRTAREVTSGEPTSFDKAMALQRWFRDDGGFEYDLTPRADGGGLETIAGFVDEDRRGYCEQFASAMAIMARTLDIPARVSVGFLRPEREDGAFVFRGTDMHAWPELFFEGIGWVKFEPTPGGSGYDAQTFSSVDVPDGPAADAPQQDARDAQQSPEPEVTTDASGGQGSSGGGWWGPFGLTGVLVAIAVGLLAIPLLVRALVSRRRWRRFADGAGRVEAAWAELRMRVRDLGEPWDVEATPRQVGRELRERLAGDADAEDSLDLLVTQTERARYDRNCDASGLREAVDTVTTSVAGRVPRGRRLRARWLPTAWIRSAMDSGRRMRADNSELIALRE